MVSFSVNRYDEDGDVIEIGVFLHFGDTSVKASESIADFAEFKDCIENIEQELKANYSSINWE